MKRIWIFIVCGIFFLGCGSRPAQEAKKDSPQVSSDFFQEGVDDLKDGHLEEAIVNLTKAIVQNPGDTEAHFVLGRLHMNLGRYEDALRHLTAVTQFQPDNGEAYLLLAGCYDLLGKKEEAIENVQNAVEIFRQEQDAQNFTKALTILQALTNEDASNDVSGGQSR